MSIKHSTVLNCKSKAINKARVTSRGICDDDCLWCHKRFRDHIREVVYKKCVIRNVYIFETSFRIAGINHDTNGKRAVNRPQRPYRSIQRSRGAWPNMDNMGNESRWWFHQEREMWSVVWPNGKMIRRIVNQDLCVEEQGKGRNKCIKFGKDATVGTQITWRDKQRDTKISIMCRLHFFNNRNLGRYSFGISKFIGINTATSVVSKRPREERHQ